MYHRAWQETNRSSTYKCLNKGYQGYRQRHEEVVQRDINSFIIVANDSKTFVELKNKDGTNLFIDIDLAIKVDPRKDLGYVNVIEKGLPNKTFFMEEAFLKHFKGFSIIG